MVLLTFSAKGDNPQRLNRVIFIEVTAVQLNTGNNT